MYELAKSIVYELAKSIVKDTAVIDNEIIESEPFNNLSGFAPQLLIHLYKRRKLTFNEDSCRFEWTVEDDIEIIFKYFLINYNVTHPRLTLAIKDLLHKGFLELKYKGGNHNSDKSIYKLSDNWKKIETIKNQKIGYIYVLKSGANYKIGRTSNFKARITQYKTANPDAIETIMVEKVNNYLAVEKQLLEQFSAKRINGEWFSLNDEDIIELLEVIIKKQSD